MCDSPWAHVQALKGLEWKRLAVRAVSEAGYQFLERWGCMMSVSLLKSEKSTEGREKCLLSGEQQHSPSIRTKGRVCY